MDQDHNKSAQPGFPADGKSRILRAAMGLFAQRGFSGVSISDVAHAAGVTKSAIYHHFQNKEALYIDVLVDACETSRQQMEAGAQGDNWRVRLYGATLALGKLVTPGSYVLSLILSGIVQMPNDAARATLDAIGDLRRMFISVLQREIANGIAAGDLRPLEPNVAGACLIGIVTAILQTHPDLPEEERTRFALELFLRGALRGEN